MYKSDLKNKTNYYLSHHGLSWITYTRCVDEFISTNGQFFQINTSNWNFFSKSFYYFGTISFDRKVFETIFFCCCFSEAGSVRRWTLSLPLSTIGNHRLGPDTTAIPERTEPEDGIRRWDNLLSRIYGRCLENVFRIAVSSFHACQLFR